jgi:hypothetical protein
VQAERRERERAPGLVRDELGDPADDLHAVALVRELAAGRGDERRVDCNPAARLLEIEGRCGLEVDRRLVEPGGRREGLSDRDAALNEESPARVTAYFQHPAIRYAA